MAIRSLGRQLGKGFRSLEGSPRGLWIVYILKLLESYSYFSMAVSFTLYLTEVFGIPDVEAGSIYGLWGTILTLFGFFLGPVIDYAGIRICLIVCFALQCASRAVMSLTTETRVVLGTILGPCSMAEAMGIPVLLIAVKRYTGEHNRGFAFALFYTVMNIAGMTAGPLFDLFRTRLQHGLQLDNYPSEHLFNNGYRLFMLTGCVSSGISLILAFFVGNPKSQQQQQLDVFASQAKQLKREQQASSSQPQQTNSLTEPLLADNSTEQLPQSSTSPSAAAQGPTGGPKGPPEGPTDSSAADSAANSEARASLQPKPQKALTLKRMMDRQGSLLVDLDYWELMKYCVMCVFSVNLKTIFRHLEATMPKYLIRAFGCGTPIGLIYAVNPTMILLLVPIVGAVTQSLNHFDMIHYGGYITALSPLFIVAFNTLWSTIPFVVMLSIGEAIWSPRWYDYSMSVAPDGKEGLFTAAGSAPLFLATLPTGFLSGKLLSSFCPDGHLCDKEHPGDPSKAQPCDGRLLWGIISLITLSSPILISLNQRWLRPCPPPDKLERVLLINDVPEDDPSRIVAPVGEEDQRLPFGEVEAEMREGGVITAAHRHST